MALIKIQRFFGAVPNELLNNPEISFKAKGLYAYLNSKPDNWDFSVERISHQAKEGVDSVRGAIHELEQFGYLIRRKHQDEKGFWEIDYILYETPIEEKTYLGKSNEGKPIEQSKKDYTKKEYTKKEKEIDDRGLSEAVELWLQYKRERKQSYKGASSIQAMINKLYDLSTGDEEIAIKIVQHCMASNYSGLFPLPNERVNKFGAAPSVRPAVNTSVMMNQDNHSNYADYVAWCVKNNVSPDKEEI
jgi:hypothetical protein